MKNKGFLIFYIIVILVGIILNFIVLKPETILFIYKFISSIVIIMIIPLSIFIFKKSKKENIEKTKIMESILQEVKPKKGIFVDILIFKHYTGDSGPDRISFYPIIRDLETNKLYVLWNSYGKYRFSCVLNGFNSTFKFNIKSYNGKDVNIGDVATYYMKQELNNFDINNNKVLFNDSKFTYAGRFVDTKLNVFNKNKVFYYYWDFPLIYNVNLDNFPDLLKDIIPFEGVVDFD